MTRNTTTTDERTESRLTRIADQVWSHDRDEGAIQNFIAEIDRRRAAMRDFEVPASDLMVNGTRWSEPRIVIPDFKSARHAIEGGSFGINPLALRHLAAKLNIDLKYLERCYNDDPELFAINCQRWLDKDERRFLLRTIDGNARAVLSDKYRILDNHMLLRDAVLPAIRDAAEEFGANLTIQEAAITEQKLYLKVVSPRIQGEIQRGDPVQAGFIVSNSEVGAGSWKVEQFLLRLVCINGMIGTYNLSKHHVGRISDGGNGEGSREIYRDETNKQVDKAIIMQTRDVVRACLDRDRFEEALNNMRQQAGVPIRQDPRGIIEVTGKAMPSGSFTETETDNIMSELMDKGDMTMWGLTNAVTAAAKKATNYDRRVKMERFAGVKMLNYSNADWDKIQKQARN